jgi:hypothetical protein
MNFPLRRIVLDPNCRYAYLWYIRTKQHIEVLGDVPYDRYKEPISLFVCPNCLATRCSGIKQCRVPFPQIMMVYFRHSAIVGEQSVDLERTGKKLK